MVYKGILRKRPRWEMGLLLAGAILFLIIEIFAGQWFGIPLAVFVIIACFFRKEQLVSDDGIDIVYYLFGKDTHHLWTWREITAIQTDYKASSPNVRLNIARDVVIRPLVMTADDAEAVLKLAKRQNRKIHIEDKDQ